MTHPRKRPLKGPMLMAGLLMCGLLPTLAQAENADVATGLQAYGDLSMFYQALVTTGVMHELKPNKEYTIFAPVNDAFGQVPPAQYPCFYAAACRPQIAALLRDHIVEGHHDLTNLVSYGSGIPTIGRNPAHPEMAFRDDYEVDGHKILSRSSINGTIIYRIDGVLSDPQELSQFQTMVAPYPVSDTVTDKTVINKTYRSPSLPPNAYPTAPEDTSETTTIIRTYTTQQDQ